MTKKKMNELVLEVCAKYEIDAEATAALDELTKPKAGGAQVDIEEITLRDESGTITHIFDTVIERWVPVYDDEGEANFYEKEGTELGWSRHSKFSEKLRKDAEKKFKATEKQLLKDVVAGEILPEDGKVVLEEAEAARKVYDAGEFGSTDKPEV